MEITQTSRTVVEDDKMPFVDNTLPGGNMLADVKFPNFKLEVFCWRGASAR